MDPRERLNQVMTEVRELDAKGVLDTTGATRMAELITEAKGLRAQIEMRGEAAEIDAWAGKSQGGMPLAASVESMRSAGSTTVEAANGSLRLAEEYGEGVYDPAIARTIGTEEYKRSFRSYLRTGAGRFTDASAMRTLQEGADASGGYLVPEDLLNKIITREPTPTRVAGMVTQLTTSRDALVIPKVNYTSDDLYTTGIRASWTGEVPASSTAMRVTDPVFGQARIPVYTAMLSIPLTNDMIEDSAFPLVSFISDKFAETIDLLRDNMILNGSGQGQPAGILLNPGADANQPAVTKTGGSTVTADSLVSLAMSLPEQYDTNGAFVMNKTSTGSAIASLKDSNNRYIWGSGLQDSGLEMGFKDRALLGYPVRFSGFMPNVGASAYPVVFGDFSGYYMVNRIGFSIQVLRELYAETNQILVLGRIRFGGQVAEPWKLKALYCHS